MKASSFLAVAAIVSALSVQPARAQQPPLFRTGVDLLPVDVIVVDDQGRPVRGLTPDDFAVSIDGEARRVLSAEWVLLTSDAVRPATPPPPEGYSSNEQDTGGRLIVLAIDQPNIRLGGGRAITNALLRFLDQLTPSDRVALVPFGRGSTPIPFTADHERVKEAITRVNGQMQALVRSPMAGVSMTLTTAIAVYQGDQTLIERLKASCPLLNGPDFCELDIQREAHQLVNNALEEKHATVRALTDLLKSLKSIEAPKSLVLVSEGFTMFDDDLDATSQLAELAPLAAAARTTIYGLQLGDQMFDASSEFPVQAREDIELRARGFDQLTSTARGALFRVTTTGNVAFERIASELTGYYLLGVESTSVDRDRTSAPLRVSLVNPVKGGLTVRARSAVVSPAALLDTSPRGTQAAAATALVTPTMIASLPLRVITFNTQGVDPTKVQLLIHADVGRGYEAPQNVAVAYIIVDQSGRIVDSQSTTERLAPTRGMASPLPFVVSAAVPPGEYVLKLAAVEGGKTGTVQHRVTAALIAAPAAPDVKLSDLIVGGPLSATGTLTRPSVDHAIRFGIVQGYLEAYGAAAAETKVRYEIARDDQSPSLVAEDVTPRVVNQSRALFSRTLSASALPPGNYRLRAIVNVGGSPVATLSRRFELAAPTALPVASAAAADVPRRNTALDSRTEFFLPIETAALAAPFQVEDALRPDTLEPFAAMVPAAAKGSFDEGIRHLRAGNHRGAEDSFKRAILPNSDFTAATVYLAVTFAASAHYIDAANAWQTALIGRSDLPQLFLWLGTALLRAREFARAQSILEEAASRWPADTRFARPLAMLYATTGKGYDAMQMLQRHIAATSGDVDALYLGVQWIYQIHVNGAVLRDRAADVALARAYADQYVRVNGPKQVLVKEWLDYLVR